MLFVKETPDVLIYTAYIQTNVNATGSNIAGYASK